MSSVDTLYALQKLAFKFCTLNPVTRYSTYLPTISEHIYVRKAREMRLRVTYSTISYACAHELAIEVSIPRGKGANGNT